MLNSSSGSGSIEVSTNSLYRGYVVPFTVNVPTGWTFILLSLASPLLPCLFAARASQAGDWMSHEITTESWCFLDFIQTEMRAKVNLAVMLGGQWRDLHLPNPFSQPHSSASRLRVLHLRPCSVVVVASSISSGCRRWCSGMPPTSALSISSAGVAILA